VGRDAAAHRSSDLETFLVTTATATPPRGRLADAQVKLSDRIGEPTFKALCALAALIAVAVIIAIAVTVFSNAGTSISHFGLAFLGHSTWNPVTSVFGAAPMIYGTFLSSVLSLVIAVPMAILIAMYLTELAPGWIQRPVAILVELLAALPSVILGLWGIAILGPFMINTLQPFLHSFLSWIPLFSGTYNGLSMLSAILILTIMVLPIITSITREVFATTDGSIKEAAYALGATRWEMMRMTVLPVARPGIVGAVILGLGRALGEAVAVTQVIGNANQISSSLFAQGTTIAAQIVNQFPNASPGIERSSLMYLGAILLVISVIVNIIGRLIIHRGEVR